MRAAESQIRGVATVTGFVLLKMRDEETQQWRKGSYTSREHQCVRRSWGSGGGRVQAGGLMYWWELTMFFSISFSFLVKKETKLLAVQMSEEQFKV